MSVPRQILPDSTYLITRRCSERRFFLRPDAFVAIVFRYLLALAAKLYGIQIHAFIVLSNHWHAVVTDVRCKLPQFLQWLHRLVSCCVNVYRGRWESMWSNEKPGVTRLETAEDVLDKMVYVLTNAVAAGLVPSASEWPGLWSAPELLLRGPIVAPRPDRYFRPKGKMPENAQLCLTKPPGFEHMSDEQFVELVRERVAEREVEIRAEREQQGQRFLATKAVLRQDWQDCPRSEPPRRRLNPHIAARDKATRIAATERLQTFWFEYRAARQRWVRGERKVWFPPGTYWARVSLGVRCHPPPQCLT